MGVLPRKKTASEIATEATNNVNRDLRGGEAFGKKILGSGLKRISNSSDSTLVRNRLLSEASGNSQQRNLQRSKGLAGLQGQSQQGQRRLASALGRSGVKGGTAAAAQLQQNAITADTRSKFEESLAIADSQAQQQGLRDFAIFTQANQKFDIQQGQKEKALELQASLGFTNLQSTERNSIRQQEAANLLALQSKNDGGKK